MREPIHIIGGGLAGPEAAWQIARRGLRSVLHEMRPAHPTPAHQTGRLAELVCSNSLKSEQESTAPWLLKEELRRLDSLLLQAAQKARVPGGHALTVDREIFSAEVTAAIASEPLVELRREEVTAIPEDAIVIVSTGPLTSDALAQEIARLTGRDRLFFYDSISPIVEADSVDMETAFWASRYGKSADGTADYLNCPFDQRQYDSFVDELLRAQAVPAHIEEDRTPFFEACLPIEELARRGRDTLRFGPMKPVGLADPRTGKRPYAVAQLRQESLRNRSFNLAHKDLSAPFWKMAQSPESPPLENSEMATSSALLFYHGKAPADINSLGQIVRVSVLLIKLLIHRHVLYPVVRAEIDNLHPRLQHLRHKAHRYLIRQATQRNVRHVRRLFQIQRRNLHFAAP